MEYLMILDIDFLKKNKQMIHFFGLGFVQLKLDDNLRMHFYHPDLTPIIHEEEIHNHRYNFISTILAGSLTQELFEIKAGLSDYYMVEESCKKEKIINPIVQDVIVTSLGNKTFLKGDSYTILTSEFHIVSTDFAITRLYRGSTVAENALIVKKRGEEVVCPFSKPLNENECWSIVEDCINRSK